MTRAWFVGFILGLLAVPSLGATSFTYEVFPKTSLVSSTQVMVLPGIFGTRKDLRFGAVAGVENSAIPLVGMDISTEWHIARFTNVVVGLIGSFSSGQRPTFGGVELGLHFYL